MRQISSKKRKKNAFRYFSRSTNINLALGYKVDLPLNNPTALTTGQSGTTVSAPYLEHHNSISSSYNIFLYFFTADAKLQNEIKHTEICIVFSMEFSCNLID